MLRVNGDYLKRILTMGQAFGLLIAAIFFQVQVEAASTTASSAIPSTPAIIAPDDMKKYIQGLGGTIDGATNTAHLSGYIDPSCSKLVRLDASGVPANGKIVFAMYDLGGGLECLKKTSDTCKVNTNCLSFEKVDASSKHRMSRPFKSYVQVEKVNTGMKIALASSGHLSVKGDDSQVRKLEAGTGCDCDITPAMKGPFKPDQMAGIKDVVNIAKKAGGSGPLKPKPIPEDEDDSDGDEPAVAQQPPLPQIMHTRTPPGLQHVPTNEEMAFQVYQDMQPYLTKEQGGTLDTGANTAYNAFVAQQTQNELGRIQTYRPSNYLLGNSAYPGYMNLNASAQSYQASMNDSLLLATPVMQPAPQQIQGYPYGYPPGYPPGYPIPAVPNN